MDNRWKTVTVVACFSLGLAACGGSSDVVPGGGLAPSSPEMITCLKRGGATTAEALDVHSDLGELVAGQLANGDVVFIITLPNRHVSGRAIQALRKKKREAGIAGVMTTSTVDDGFALVVAVGHEGVNGGMPSSASERLARECATRPRS